MTEIEKLKKQVEELKEKIKTLENKEQLERKERYYYVDIDSEGNFYVDRGNNGMTTEKYNNKNYFILERNALVFLDTLNELKKLQYYHDIYCPEYAPDWNNEDEEKWYVFFETDEREYYYERTWSFYRSTIYFDSEETAGKVCDELNKNF